MHGYRYQLNNPNSADVVRQSRVVRSEKVAHRYSAFGGTAFASAFGGALKACSVISAAGAEGRKNAGRPIIAANKIRRVGSAAAWLTVS